MSKIILRVLLCNDKLLDSKRKVGGIQGESNFKIRPCAFFFFQCRVDKLPASWWCFLRNCVWCEQSKILDLRKSNFQSFQRKVFTLFVIIHMPNLTNVLLLLLYFSFLFSTSFSHPRTVFLYPPVIFCVVALFLSFSVPLFFFFALTYLLLFVCSLLAIDLLLSVSLFRRCCLMFVSCHGRLSLFLVIYVSFGFFHVLLHCYSYHPSPPVFPPVDVPCCFHCSSPTWNTSSPLQV